MPKNTAESLDASPDTVEPLSPDAEALLAELIELQQTLDSLGERKQRLHAALMGLRDLGRLPEKPVLDGWALAYSPGRPSYAFPPDVEAIRASLKAAEEAAIVTGAAVLKKPVTPFWSLRKPSPKA